MASPPHHGAKGAIPWIVTVVIFALIFRRVPIGKVVEALRDVLSCRTSRSYAYSVAYLFQLTFALTHC
jgi:hypothetical protein